MALTDGLYLHDAYLRQFDAHVLRSTEDGVVLDRTAFYPAGGGQPDDRGTLEVPGAESRLVTGVSHAGAGILHGLDGPGPPDGTPVRGLIDWPRRYAHMRYYSALHILSGVVFHRFGSGITGGQIYADRARMDFSLPEFGRELAEDLVRETNEVIGRGLPIEVRFIPQAEAVKDASLVRVAADLLPGGEMVRLIDIVGFDVQADGGTHVRSTAEVGDVRLDRLENKGARNKRLHLSLLSQSP